MLFIIHITLLLASILLLSIPSSIHGMRIPEVIAWRTDTISSMRVFCDEQQANYHFICHSSSKPSPPTIGMCHMSQMYRQQRFWVIVSADSFHLISTLSASVDSAINDAPRPFLRRSCMKVLFMCTSNICRSPMGELTSSARPMLLPAHEIDGP